MAQVINTNIQSLTAQRNLQTTGSQLATALQRLSSGLRINSAKDDSAGLAISERFTTQIRGLNQAIRNANDGISLSQTAEAALGTVTENLQRVRELAVQSLNATNSTSDRATLDNEVQQRLNEIDRIASQTSFNGRNVLDGSFGSASFQVGANVGQTIELSLTEGVRTSDIGAVAEVETDFDNTLTGFVNLQSAGTSSATTLSTNGGAAAAPQSGTFTLNVGDVSVSVDLAATSGAALDLAGQRTAVASAIDGAVGRLNDAGFILVDSSDGSVLEAGDIDSTALGNLEIGRADGAAFVITEGTTGDVDFSFADFAGLTAGEVEETTIAVGANDLKLQIGDDSDNTVTVAAGTYDAEGFIGAVNQALEGNGTATITDEGTLSIISSLNITVTTAATYAGTNTATNGVTLAAFFAADTELTEGAAGDLTESNVRTVDAANDALARIDAALTSVSDLRSNFGAIQNRFESTIQNLTTTSENLQASRSRILDADFAQETANLTRAQILQQAGISVLSQANVQPQNVLALLQ